MLFFAQLQCIPVPSFDMTDTAHVYCNYNVLVHNRKENPDWFLEQSAFYYVGCQGELLRNA